MDLVDKLKCLGFVFLSVGAWLLSNIGVKGIYSESVAATLFITSVLIKVLVAVAFGMWLFSTKASRIHGSRSYRWVCVLAFAAAGARLVYGAALSE